MDDQEKLNLAEPTQDNVETSTTEKKEVGLGVEGQPQQPEPKVDTEGGKKTRLEKRIETLQGKLEGAKTEEDRDRIKRLIEKLTEKKQAGYVPFPKEPLIKPEDLETGVDPQELERRQALREFALKEEIKQEIQAQNEVVNNIKDHMRDYEETLKANPELDPNSPSYDKNLADFVAQQYFLANSVYNPFTGKSELVPTIKTSQIYAQVKSLIEQERTKAQADVKGRLLNDYQSSAIPPSPRPSIPEEDEQALFERAKSSGRVEDWAEVIKARLG